MFLVRRSARARAGMTKLGVDIDRSLHNQKGESAMSANLVSVVMQFLTPDMIAKIASALGLDRAIAQKAIGGAVPALLAGLADVASTPEGARQLSALAQQQPGSLESLKSLNGGSGQNTLAESGA